MPLLKSLFMAAARRAAADPEVRARAEETLRTTARKAGETMGRTRQRLDAEVDAVMEDAPDTATRAEIAGRLTRRFLDRARGDDQGN